jgi:PAS domain S-box-containing protein
MPKKKPIDKRLKNLFEDVQPEQAIAETRPVSSKRAPSDKFQQPVMTRQSDIVRQPAEMVSHSAQTESVMTLAFQAGQNSWATLQVMDETEERKWSQDEQLLVKQVADQLSLALENARLFQETQRRAEELTVLNELGNELSTKLDPKGIADVIYKYTSRLMNTKNFYIALYDEKNDEKSYPLAFEEGQLLDLKPSKVSGRGFTDHIIRNKKIIFAPENVLGHMKALGIDFVPLNEDDTPSQCWLGVPMMIGDQILGVIAVQSVDTANLYDEHDRDILATIASQAAIAAENARLFQEAQRRAQETAALAEVGREISATLNLEIVLERISLYALELLQATSAAAYLPIEHGEKWQAVAAVGLDAIPIKNDFVNRSEGVLGKVVLQHAGTIMNNVDTMPDAITISGTDRVDLFEHLMGVPVLSGNRVTGLLAVWRNGEGREFSQTELDFLTSLSLQTAIAIENARLFQETTQRQQAQERSEAELRALFSAMEDVIIVYDKDGRYVRIAPTNPALLFRPPQDMVGKLIHEILPKELHEPFMATIHKVLEGEENISIEYPLTLGGGTFWFDANVSKLTGDQVFWVARDISERKLSEEALQRRNTYLAVSSEIGRLVTSTLDLNTIFSRTVSLISERFGFYHSSIFITEETGFNTILREATGEAGEKMKAQRHSLVVGSNSIVGTAAESGEPIVVNDVENEPLHRPNPYLLDTSSEAAIPLRIGTRIVGVIDIQSTQKNAFSQDDISVLQSLADQVAVAIDNARSYELSQQLIKDLREVDQLKSQFLANMSHELRTPLNSIIGFSRVILKGIDGPVTEMQQQDLTAIYNSGQHLLGLINDVLDLARIEAGKMELNFEEVHLAEMTTSVMSTAKGLVKEKPIQLLQRIPSDMPTVRGDTMRVRQVLLNLISNASKFTDEGSITVQTLVQTGPTGKMEARVNVIDTGPGISAEDQEKLFKAFSQVDGSATRKSGGSGLGLSICANLVQLQGGNIGVHSEIGKGSTFWFTLPLYQQPTEMIPEGKKVVLAIDDDLQVISLYERYLNPQGYHVVPLTDPSVAKERILELKPFAVTLDIMMPSLDGWTVLTSLKSDPATRDYPVVICSITEKADKGFSLGAADYLVKPILEEDLVHALDRLNKNGEIHEVLVIDDDPNDLRLIGKILNEHNQYKPILVEGGRRGWEVINEKAPHAIILDIFMPEMDGFTILENLRLDPKLRQIPVLVVSGGGLTNEQQQQLNEYGQRLINKGSLNADELIASIESALKRIGSY